MTCTIEEKGEDQFLVEYVSDTLTEFCDDKIKTLRDYAFYSRKALTMVDLAAIEKIRYDAFAYCENLTRIILRSSSVCTYLSNGATYDPKNENLKIFVPVALLDSYKAATNWKRLADHFVALEDYTVDGTTTGELDESKLA